MTSHADLQNEALAGHLLDQYAGRIARSRRPYIIGLSGLQGSGKSTLARVMKAQAEARGWATEVLSLDDFYYARSEREALARDVHPLLRSRGVPGTHEIELLMSVLAALPHASDKLPVSHPRFDKGRDTRFPPSRWPRTTRPPKLVIVEGWALGIRPQLQAALARPVNELERSEDPDSSWRHWVNKQLRGYQPLWRKFDALIVLQAPSWEIVRRWRGEQEQELLARHAPLAMDASAMERFLAHFERLSRHALATLPALADTCVEYDDDRHVTGLSHG
ncbi:MULTISPECIES: kinase [Rhodanobacter]|uniref:Putative kinase n=1 Tax=Rhodanobacter denitrificans TaxID=666685 RepID=M4NBI1_9GAMM|nr:MULTISPECIES: kinase [Rhodanobacter]AGG88005.1 putative kinase [Rhodanobacter denitrificans]KZC19531.1 kinase [Rhodanobacter denitrificans]UJJ51903.1 kinase [Rhodanobacter denitrificans]UJM87159.1 kinase [Rhodanobacter denitrificans]UJM94647.1 kinase [Rhodanobacter denitrificans]